MSKTVFQAAGAVALTIAAAGAAETASLEETLVVDRALKAVEAADRAADARWCACESPAALRKLQAETRAKVVESMGSLPEKCPLDAQTVGRVERDGYSIEKVMFASEPQHHVTAHLFLPDPAKFPGRRPGIVIPCGHSLNGKAEASYQRGGLMAARRGFAALLYDPVDQGERRQSRKNESLWTTRAHNEIGRRAELLGWSMARFRLRDGVRAVDYLAARPEVDPARLGVMGHSGGGTMTSWIMALDDRIRCAAPSGFLTTMHDVCNAIGPQDAEQFVFGELAFGFNHLGHILLRAPSPVLMCASQEDFFPIKGALATAELAARVYGKLGASADFRLSHVMGPHHWHESTRAFAVDWMDWKLQGGPAPKAMDHYRKLDAGFSEAAVDTGLSDSPGGLREMRARTWPASVTPTGSTLALPGERTVYDQMRDEAMRQKAARLALCPDTVRRVAGIRKAADIRAQLQGGETLVMDDGTPVSMRISGSGASVLYVAEGGDAPAFADSRVVSADIRGFGATGRIKHVFYSVHDADEELAVLCHLLGQKLVGQRAEDIIAVAKFAGDRPKLVARGRAAIPAAHAYYTARELFSGIELVDPPPSWEAYLTDDGLTGRFANIVRGAWAHYDWTDLVKP